jgi:hypothetical protein
MRGFLESKTGSIDQSKRTDPFNELETETNRRTNCALCTRQQGKKEAVVGFVR